MIYDIITYNGEKDILDLRLNVLYPYVGKFIIIEFDETFSGKKKPKRLLKDWNSDWKRFVDKIDYVQITKNEYSKYRDLADTSPNVPMYGPLHWKQEFCQKESIKDALLDLQDEDIVCIGDVDEIWHPSALSLPPSKLKLHVYSYYLNNLSDEEFYGTIIAQYKDIKDKCLNHLRTNDLPRTVLEYGCHFTSMGGVAAVKSKLMDSYTAESYAAEQVIDNLEYNIKNNMDFLFRGFEYEIDESHWPQYLKENKQKYKHLLKS